MSYHHFENDEEKDEFHKKVFARFSPITLGSTECTSAIDAITSPCLTAEDLLHELTLSKDHWDPPFVQTSENPGETTQKNLRINKDSLGSPWYFRGQADSDWDLRPKPWRERKGDKNPSSFPELRKYSGHSSLVRPFNDDGQKYDLLNIECDVLARYERTLEQAGISLPHLSHEEKQRRDTDSTEPRRYPYVYKKEPYESELIGGNLIPLIAQHHGLPTRLLDLTTKPFVSAFMACRGFYEDEASLDNLDEEKHIAIWAFSWESIDMSRFWLDNGYSDSCRATDFAQSILLGRYKLERPSASVEQRIKAQGGLFIYPPSARQFLIKFQNLPSLESYLINTGLLRILERMMPVRNFIDLGFKRILEQEPDTLQKELSVGENFKNNTFPYFRKLTLPYSEVHKLMECLDAMGINESSLFPGIQQGATTLKHRTLRNRAMGCENISFNQELALEPLDLSDHLRAIAQGTSEP